MNANHLAGLMRWIRVPSAIGDRGDMKSLKKLIMAILLLLVTLFMSGMGLMSWLNLSYSQEAMSALRMRQIEDTFHANLDRIDSQHKLLEMHTSALARLGELFYRQRHKGASNTQTFERALIERVRNFPEAYGGGIWFTPFTYTPRQRAFALFAHWDKNAVAIDPRYNDESSPYMEQDWYKTALPTEQGASCPQSFHWTPAYYDPIAENAMLAVTTCMYDDQGKFIGLASTTWRNDDIMRLVRSVDVTQSSFAFFIDGNDRKLSSLTMGKNADTSQAIMDSLSNDYFSSPAAAPEISSSGRFRVPVMVHKLSIEGRDYRLFVSKTRANMTFGIGVPQDEIDSVLTPMRQSNLRIAIATGIVLLVLSMVILYIVATIMRLLQALYTDALTQLENRAKLLHDTHVPGRESLILVNIDAFKEINDFYGHQCGDNLLRELAEALSAFVARESAWSDCVLYKMPADEFAVRFPVPLDPDDLEARMAALAAFAGTQVFRWDGQEFGISVTQGAATSARGPHTANGAELLSCANIALKLARRQHRHFGVYDPALRVREEYEHNLLWASLLRAGLQEDRVVPFFQPILNNHSGKVEKFECLVRLINEQGQAVSPGLFLDIAKKLRIYGQITRIMVDKSFAQFRDEPFDFSLNLSYEDLTDPATISFIRTRLKETGIGPRVIFEILESEGIKNYDEVKSFIDDVKTFGARVAIDDFGAGYSNFEHLLRLGADIIKIDGSLIHNLDNDANARTITRGIVQFARKLRMQIVAEFVHSRSVQERVLHLGIDYSQGAWLGMPAAQLCDRVPEAPSGEAYKPVAPQD
ncbi:EAL domain-containing protein [Pseudomonas sp. GOM7]|uniref:EAL domain-containing protein n=1 Tax=Pseudomonas sp. GOM7 TaxID=2998079 RepID=UPI00227B897B|nr:EAL domain-containing protein [Pseudomonas sp. GOM7]WAJ36377.1 EAL domain-containing protein [Pseudomonas sp. GOM7]